MVAAASFFRTSLGEHLASVLGFALADRARNIALQTDASGAVALACAQVAFGGNVAPQRSFVVLDRDRAGYDCGYWER